MLPNKYGGLPRYNLSPAQFQSWIELLFYILLTITKSVDSSSSCSQCVAQTHLSKPSGGLGEIPPQQWPGGLSKGFTHLGQLTTHTDSLTNPPPPPPKNRCASPPIAIWRKECSVWSCSLHKWFLGLTPGFYSVSHWPLVTGASRFLSHSHSFSHKYSLYIIFPQESILAYHHAIRCNSWPLDSRFFLHLISRCQETEKNVSLATSVLWEGSCPECEYC